MMKKIYKLGVMILGVLIVFGSASYYNLAKSEVVHATEWEGELFHTDHIYIDIRSNALRSHQIQKSDVCKEYKVYDYLKKEFEENSPDGKPIHLYGCGSPDGSMPPVELREETLFVAIDFNILLPDEFVQEINFKILTMELRMNREKELRHVYPRSAWESVYAVPFTDDLEKLDQDMSKYIHRFLDKIVESVYFGRVYSKDFIPEGKKKELLQELAEFLEINKNNPESIRKRYEKQKTIYELSGQQMPKFLDEQYQSYLKGSMGSE